MKPSSATTKTPETRHDSRIVSILLQISILGVCIATLFSTTARLDMTNESAPQYSGQTLGVKLDSGETGETKRYLDEPMADFLKRHAELVEKVGAGGGGQ